MLGEGVSERTAAEVDAREIRWIPPMQRERKRREREPSREKEPSRYVYAEKVMVCAGR